MTMVRKQMYVHPEQDAKLKRLAEEHGCSEADVLREAVDQLPDDEPRWLQRARAAGLIVSVPAPITDEERAAARERTRALFAPHARAIFDQLMADRADSRF
jgi:antitoxin ParD1/3/4